MFRRTTLGLGLLLLCGAAGCVGPGLEPPGRAGVTGGPKTSSQDAGAVFGNGNGGGAGTGGTTGGFSGNTGAGNGSAGTGSGAEQPSHDAGADASLDDDAGVTH